VTGWVTGFRWTLNVILNYEAKDEDGEDREDRDQEDEKEEEDITDGRYKITFHDVIYFSDGLTFVVD